MNISIPIVYLNNSTSPPYLHISRVLRVSTFYNYNLLRCCTNVPSDTLDAKAPKKNIDLAVNCQCQKVFNILNHYFAL